MSDESDTAESMLWQRKALADFSDFVLGSDDLDAVLTEACQLVGDALGTGRAKVLEIGPEGESLFMGASVGWAADLVGQVRVPMAENSSHSIPSGREGPS